MAEWAQRMVVANGDSWGQATYDHLMTQTPTNIYRAFAIHEALGFPQYADATFYANKALEWIDNNATNAVNTSAEVNQYLLNYNSSDIVNEFFRLNITNWTLPDGDVNWWANRANAITDDCKIREKVMSTDDQGAEFLRLYENWWWFYTFNTEEAEDAYYAHWENDYFMGQIYYDAIMGKDPANRGTVFETEYVNTGIVDKMSSQMYYRFYNWTDDYGNWDYGTAAPAPSAEMS